MINNPVSIGEIQIFFSSPVRERKPYLAKKFTIWSNDYISPLNRIALASVVLINIGDNILLKQITCIVKRIISSISTVSINLREKFLSFFYQWSKKFSIPLGCIRYINRNWDRQFSITNYNMDLIQQEKIICYNLNNKRRDKL